MVMRREFVLSIAIFLLQLDKGKTEGSRIQTLSSNVLIVWKKGSCFFILFSNCLIICRRSDLVVHHLISNSSAGR